MREKIKINFEDFWHHNSFVTIQKENPIFKLLSARFDLELSKEPDFLVYSCFGKNFLKYNCVRIFYTGENIRPDFSECDYAFSFDYPITERNYRLPLYILYNGYKELKRKNFGYNLDKKINEKQRFCNFVYSNKKGKERVEFFKELQKYKKVDSGGRIMNNIGYLVKDKLSFLQQYKFTIAFENSSYPGYSTEKLLQAFITNTIPIYWGNPLIHKDFNTNSFINCHDYKNFEEVIEKVIEVDNDDSLYLEYIAQPPIIVNSENKYLDEINIIRRFENIFSNHNLIFITKKKNIIRYYSWLMDKCPKMVYSSIKNYIEQLRK
ncbi:MAG: glycosyltransferase [Bacteroidetes bacterium]|nr:glycosyltransferase [Bacteroidota bacterium]